MLGFSNCMRKCFNSVKKVVDNGGNVSLIGYYWCIVKVKGSMFC